MKSEVEDTIICIDKHGVRCVTVNAMKRLCRSNLRSQVSKVDYKARLPNRADELGTDPSNNRFMAQEKALKDKKVR